MLPTTLAAALEAAFFTTLALTGLLYLACYLAPAFMVRLNSVPWAFHADRNLDLRYQSVLYAAFHKGRWSQLSHLSLVLDQPLWYALLWTIHPGAVAAMLALVIVQSALLRGGVLLIALPVSAALMAAAGWGLVEVAGLQAAREIAYLGLLAGGVLRFFGHVTEPIPPGLNGDPQRFKSLSREIVNVPLLIAPFVGAVSEFAAGIPVRLFVVQVFWLADRLGLPTGAWGRWREHVVEARAVHAEGWSGSETTAWMLQAEGGR